ncbi:kinesin motor domain containing protein [Stylonychia lemnae]|uniref:Kinesin motor domain containing protein n=1 Tax=Stylonychia lemnae TaxID=5949 RepID=A0A077ZXH6_STYLE|nr:kinesin motor domain containing protein [Stylonychia lemnae]|eukprot:CDW74261.1 kinesin motor domain containing protein [Stylonychia lemnae]
MSSSFAQGFLVSNCVDEKQKFNFTVELCSRTLSSYELLESVYITFFFVIIYLISKGYRIISKEAKDIMLKPDFMFGVAVFQALQFSVFSKYQLFSRAQNAYKVFFSASFICFQEMITFLKVTVMIHEQLNQQDASELLVQDQRRNIWDLNFDEQTVIMFYFNLNRLWNNFDGQNDAQQPLKFCTNSMSSSDLQSQNEEDRVFVFLNPHDSIEDLEYNILHDQNEQQYSQHQEYSPKNKEDQVLINYNMRYLQNLKIASIDKKSQVEMEQQQTILNTVIEEDPAQESKLDEVLVVNNNIRDEVTLIRDSENKKQKKNMKAQFDKVFADDLDDKQNQQKVYVFYKERVKQVVDGYNHILIAFGESKSGKTYSMIGNQWDLSIKNQVQNLRKQLKQHLFYSSYIQNSGQKLSDDEIMETHGIIPRAIQDIYQAVSEKELSNSDLRIKIFNSSLLFHCDLVYDLLQDQDQNEELELKEQENSVFVKGLTEYQTQNSIESYALLKRSIKSLQQRDRFLEPQIRKHTYVFNIEVEVTDIRQSSVQRSTLKLIEFQPNDRHLLNSGNNIDKFKISKQFRLQNGLNQFKNVINSLALPVNQQKYIPYRESSITKYLMEYFSGNAHIDILCNITLDQESVLTTIDTFKLCKQARKIELKPQIKKEKILKKSKSNMASPRQHSYLQEILKIKKNKGLNPEEKMQLMSQQLKKLNQSKRRLKNKLQTVDDYEKLKQEGFLIKKEIHKLIEQSQSSLAMSSIEVSRSQIQSYSVDQSYANNHKINPLNNNIVLPSIRKQSIELSSSQNTRYNTSTTVSNKDRYQKDEADFRKRLVNQNRCPKCTLYLPCSHFDIVEQADKFVSDNFLAKLPRPVLISEQLRSFQKETSLKSHVTFEDTLSNPKRQISLTNLKLNSRDIDLSQPSSIQLLTISQQEYGCPINNNPQGIYAKNKALAGKYFTNQTYGTDYEDDQVVIRIRGRNNDFIEQKGSLTRSFNVKPQKDMKTIQIKEIQSRLSYLDQIEKNRQEQLQSKIKAIEDKRKQRQDEDQAIKLKQQEYKRFLENQTIILPTRKNQQNSVINQMDQRKNMIVKDLLKKRYDKEQSSNQTSKRLNQNNRNSSTNRSSLLDFSEHSVSTTKNDQKSKVIFNNDDL